MTLSYSAVAGAGTEAASSSTPSTESATAVASSSSSSKAPVKHLILDAGPLLSLTPLRHLANTFHTTPLVLRELRDPKAREHWERLGLSGVEVKVEGPSSEAIAAVTAFAKLTGDYAVLSQTDLSVVALTYQYEVLENGLRNIRTRPGEKRPQTNLANGEEVGGRQNLQDEEEEGEEESSDDSEGSSDAGPMEEQDMEQDIGGETLSAPDQPLDNRIAETDNAPAVLDKHVEQSTSRGEDGADATGSPAVAPNEDDESDGGEWITPSNVASHRNRDLGLLPEGPKGGPSTMTEPIAAACMTGDFAVQNVLLGMGLGLVGEGGKRIAKVKSWVLRCHACFKISKDSSKRFCPSCGNPSLLRTTVTTSAKTGEQKIHLKKNFQYRLRGTKYTIPDAKAGRAKGQQKAGTGLILREDQLEWQNAVKSEEVRRQKEERKAAKGTLSGWNDPDWLPDMITVGMSGKGRTGGHNMPSIGHGRRNPNQARRKR